MHQESTLSTTDFIMFGRGNSGLAWLVTMANGMESDLEGLEYLHAGLLIIEYNQIKSPNTNVSQRVVQGLESPSSLVVVL